MSLLHTLSLSVLIFFLSPSAFAAPPIVVIDPGHGGTEEGAIGVGGIKEKDVVLAISKRLSALLEDRLGVEVVLTRKDDALVELETRTEFANTKNADLFVSIHANASEKKTAKGVETYYLDNTNDKQSLRLAAKENKSTKKDNSDLAFMLSDLIQTAKQEDSIKLAHKIQSSLVEILNYRIKDLKNLGVKKAPFFVLMGAHMPCVLVEVSFIDHPVEGKLLGTIEYQNRVAYGIFEGIQTYLEEKGSLKKRSCDTAAELSEDGKCAKED